MQHTPDNPSNMIHLALECSGRIGSVALLEGDRLVAQERLAAEQRTTQALAPAIQRLLSQRPDTSVPLGSITVVSGPGSFTGLRIGVTTAKTLAYATGAALMAVNSLQVLALQATLSSAAPAQPEQLIATAIKAYRGQVYCALWRTHADGIPRPVSETQAMDAPLFHQELGVFVAKETIRPVILIGDGIDPEGLAASEEANPPLLIPEPEAITRAAVAGRLGWWMYRQGKTTDFWTLEPDYLRPSAAEEKADSIIQ